MSLSARESQVLDAIEERLASSDPTLASLAAMFTRLTAAEEMPIRVNPDNRGHSPRNSPHRDARSLCRRIGWQSAMLLLWLLIALTMIATALTIGGVGGK